MRVSFREIYYEEKKNALLNPTLPLISPLLVSQITTLPSFPQLINPPVVVPVALADMLFKQVTPPSCADFTPPPAPEEDAEAFPFKPEFAPAPPLPLPFNEQTTFSVSPSTTCIAFDGADVDIAYPPAPVPVRGTIPSTYDENDESLLFAADEGKTALLSVVEIVWYAGEANNLGAGLVIVQTLRESYPKRLLRVPDQFTALASVKWPREGG